MNRPNDDALSRSPRYLNLLLQDLQLLVPQTDVHMLAPLADMQPPAPATGSSVGRFEQSAKVWPIYVLGSDLTPQPEIPDDYRIAVLLRHEAMPYGLLCRQAYLLEGSRIAPHPLPACMRTPQAPLLALYGEEVHVLSSAKTLNRLLAAPG